MHVPFDLEEAYANYVSEHWREHAELSALSAGQLGVYYQSRGSSRGRGCSPRRRLFMRRTGLPSFPRWPLDESVVHLLRFYALCLLAAADARELDFRWFWPGSTARR